MAKPRVYLDWNASAPLRPEARAAMLEAMDVVGNPSSVHAEGRAARAIVERARAQVAYFADCDEDEVIFTSGATEACATVLAQPWRRVVAHDGLHDAIIRGLPPHAERSPSARPIHSYHAFERDGPAPDAHANLYVGQGACGETGVIDMDHLVDATLARDMGWSIFMDETQKAGRAHFGFGHPACSSPSFACLSSHKLQGPKGVGALFVEKGRDLAPLIDGGGQEKRRRSGTENVVAIAGFGVACFHALSDDWDSVEKLRNILEERLSEATPDLIIVGRDTRRLPNTSCFAVPGWKGETQVMQMDLAGFAVSAGSACSSGKVGPSRVLKAMGADDVAAQSAIRVSIGPTTTQAEVMAFADAWIERYRRFAAKRPAEDRVPEGA